MAFNQGIGPTTLYSIESPERELSNEYSIVGPIRRLKAVLGQSLWTIC